MTMLANNPFCVWFGTGQMHTFKTLSAAQSFARKRGGRIGEWSEVEHWWLERTST